MCEPRIRHAIKVNEDNERDFVKVFEDSSDEPVDLIHWMYLQDVAAQKRANIGHVYTGD